MITFHCDQCKKKVEVPEPQSVHTAAGWVTFVLTSDKDGEDVDGAAAICVECLMAAMRATPLPPTSEPEPQG